MDNGCSVTPRPGSCCYRLEHQRAAGHTFAPGTTVLIVNTGNGVVVSLTVANDGSLTGSIQASTFDRLIVTITDPIGRTATLQRSTFVAADGTTAVGAGGGTVTGPGGLELRVPEGAIGTAATFRIAAVDYAATFPSDPPVDLPGGTIGAAMRIETDHPGRFAREIDLAFPRPAAASDGAFFYVYRRHVGPNGQVRDAGPRVGGRHRRQREGRDRVVPLGGVCGGRADGRPGDAGVDLRSGAAAAADRGRDHGPANAASRGWFGCPSPSGTSRRLTPRRPSAGHRTPRR